MKLSVIGMAYLFSVRAVKLAKIIVYITKILDYLRVCFFNCASPFAKIPSSLRAFAKPLRDDRNLAVNVKKHPT